MKPAPMVWVCALAGVSAAMTADEYKRSFADLLGDGKYARIVWQYGGRHGWDGAKRDSDAHIYGMDTRDGIVRKLTRDDDFTGGHGFLDFPHLTEDGRRVVFFNRKDLKVYVVEWDGGPARMIAEGYFSDGTWRGENKDWVCVAKAVSATDPGAVYRINIDDPSERVVLWDKPTRDGVCKTGQWGWGNSWQSLSADGKYLAVALPHPGMHIVSVPNGETHNVYLNNSCWLQISRNNNYRVIMTGTPPEGQNSHDWITIRDMHGAVLVQKNIGEELRYENIRWSNDEDIVTYDRNGVFVLRVSNLEYVNITDKASSSPNMMIYTGDGTDTGKAPTIAEVNDVYSLPGQTLSIAVHVTADPLATLSAQGLPEGLVLQSGATPSAAFTISGEVVTEGTWTVTLAATNSRDTDTSTFVVTVGARGNMPPVVDAGPDKTVAVDQANVTLNGTATDDGKPSSTLVTRWTQTSGPSASSITAPSALNTGVSFAAAGVFEFELSATDGLDTSRSRVSVTVIDAVPFRVLSPQPGDTVVAGSTVPVKWQAYPMLCMEVHLSVNAGRDWTMISTDGCVGTDTTAWDWHVPVTMGAGPEARVKVSVYNDASRYALSEGTFVLANPSSRSHNPVGHTGNKSVHWQVRNSGAIVSIASLPAGARAVVMSLDGRTVDCVGTGSGHNGRSVSLALPGRGCALLRVETPDSRVHTARLVNVRGDASGKVGTE